MLVRPHSHMCFLGAKEKEGGKMHVVGTFPRAAAKSLELMACDTFGGKKNVGMCSMRRRG